MKIELILIMATLVFGCGAIVLPDSPQPVLTDDNLLTGFVRVDPDDKKPETLSTCAWLWQDGGDLVVRFAAEIDSSFTRGYISVKDEGTYSDYLRVQLITIPDAYYAYYYVAYPLGNLQDGVRNEAMGVDYAWNSHYSYTSDVAENTWTVTMRIPLAELRYKQDTFYDWKIILTRYHYKTEEFYSLPYANTKDGKDYFLKAQDIRLQTLVAHELDLSFKPYFVKSFDLVNHTTSYDPEHVGLDIAFNPGQRTRIKLALNPDFSDIPMDSAQDDYNSKYPPYYDENRFFFTEDLDAFGMSYDILNTRNIVQPRFAFKATGNSKVLNWGVLGAFDKELRDEDEVINRDDYFQVLALNPNWRKFQMHNSLTSRMNYGYYNHVYANAMNWEFLPHVNLNTNLCLSALKNESQEISEPLTGYKGALSLNADPGDFDFSLGYVRVSRDLAFDAGYLYETDYEYVNSSGSWNRTYADRIVRYLSFSAYASGYHSNLSTAPYYAYEASAYSNLNLASKFNFLANVTSARVPDLFYNLHDVYSGMVGCTWAKLSNFRIYGGYTYSSELVYFLSGTYPRHRININTWANPLKNLSMGLVGNWTHYGYDKLIDPAHGTVVLDNDYVVLNATLDYTPRKTFKISFGSGLSTYERSGDLATISYYGNLRYEFKPEWFLFMGFKSAQTQDEPSSWTDPAGHFRKDLATVYAKVSVTI
jgi:hypothetical protein